MYYLTKFDNVIESGFWVNSKDSICKFMQANLWNINYSTSVCPFEPGKCGKEGKKLQKSEYLKNEKLFRLNIKKEAVSLSWC